MDDRIRTLLANMNADDRQVQSDAFYALIETTDQPVDWAYEAWDDVVATLTHKDNLSRAISSQVLCNLAKSDPERRIIRDFDVLFNVTRDSRFVTARHCMQALWKVGVAGDEQRQVLMANLALRFKECITEKNCTLIRGDIVESLRNVYLQVSDEAIRALALSLMETEEDLKYRKKYATIWKK